MKKIEINPFDEKSVKDAIRELNELKKKYKQLEQQICFELAEIGSRVAQRIYDRWSSAWDNKRVEVVAVKTATGASILANGESVCFLEFGSGVTANGKTIEGYTFTPGSWSSTLGSGQFSELGFWYWNDTKYRYIPAANAMQSAIAVMKDHTKEVVERVMKGANA